MVSCCKGWGKRVQSEGKGAGGLLPAQEIMETAAFPLSSSTVVPAAASLDLFWAGFDVTVRDVKEGCVLSSRILHCPKQILYPRQPGGHMKGLS